MTLKHGFEAGLVLGGTGWLYFNGYVTFAPLVASVKVSVTLVAVAATVAAVLLTIANVFRRRSVFGTTIDGFIYGLATSFDVLYIIQQVYLGELPLP